jgi:hypothetical protein
MKLSIIPLSQRDIKWSGNKLGKSTVLTIGSDGCLLVCHSMLFTYYGHEATPDVLNEIYKSKGVFDGTMINFYAAGNIHDDINAVEYYNCIDVPCDLTKIDKCLINKQPVIAWVDNVNNDNKPDHFVLIIGKSDDGHYFTNDPWTGETYYFDAKWGDPAKFIYGLRIYSGIPKIDTSNEDKIRDLEDKINSLNETIASLSLENNQLRSDLTEQEKDNEDLAGQLNTARIERDKANWEREQAEIKSKRDTDEIQELKKRIDTQETTIKGLRNDYKSLQNKKLEEFSKWTLLFELFRKRGGNK